MTDQMTSASLRGASLCGADLRGADLRGADLFGADLSGADLRGADLFGATLINCYGLYSARPPFMSSRHEALYAGVFERGGALVLLFSAGCARNVTADELRAKVHATHSANDARTAQYCAAIEFIYACFSSDMAEGRFEVVKG